MTKGGKRDNSGRSKLPDEVKKQNFNLRLRPELIKRFRETAKRENKTHEQLVEERFLADEC